MLVNRLWRWPNTKPTLDQSLMFASVNLIGAFKWNAVTSPETFLNGFSVKTMLVKSPPRYFIVLYHQVKMLQVKAVEFHRIYVISQSSSRI